MTEPKKKLEAKVTELKEMFNYLNKNFMRMVEYTIEMDRHEGGTQEIKRIIFERGHAVGILAYDPRTDEVVLINEMRPGNLAAGDYPYTDTLPAGGIGKGETAVDAAIRETMEETGLTLRDAKLIIPKSFVSPGGTSEAISIVFGIVDATQTGGVFGNADESENIKTSRVKTDEYLARVNSGDINDMKTMLAAYWLVANRDDLQKKYAPKVTVKKLQP